MSQSVKAYEGLYAQTLQLATEYQSSGNQLYNLTIKGVCSDGTYDISQYLGVGAPTNGKIYQLQDLNGSFASLNNALVDTTDPLAQGVWGENQVQKLKDICSVFGFTYSGPGLREPSGIALDSSGNLLIADTGHHRILKATIVGGNITSVSLVAGTGTAGSTGDSGLATSAKLNGPSDVAVDSSGNIYIADTANGRIRKVTISTGIITTLTTSPSFCYGVTINGSYMYYTGGLNNLIYKNSITGGSETIIAGTGTAGSSGDNGPATSASIYSPHKIALDSSGNIYIADTRNNRIRMIYTGTTGSNTFAGITQTWTNGYIYLIANLGFPGYIAFNSSGTLHVSSADSIYSVNNFSLTTVVGGVSEIDTSEDGRAPNHTRLSSPYGILFDSVGNLYIGEATSTVSRIRKSDGVVLRTLG